MLLFLTARGQCTICQETATAHLTRRSLQCIKCQAQQQLQSDVNDPLLFAVEQ